MNKLILVPESMYKGLLTSSSRASMGKMSGGGGGGLTTDADYTDRTNIEYTKRKLEGVKKSRKLNASAKNVLLNQELRRYLHMRNEEKNKPIKVEVTKGARLVATPAQTLAVDEQGNVNALAAGADRIPPRRRGGVEKARREPRRRRRANGDVAAAQQQLPATPPAVGTPLPPPIRRLSTVSALSEGERISQLYDYLSGNKDRFGITDDDEIIARANPREIVPDSDLRAVVEHFINPQGRAPAGYGQLKTRGNADAKFRQLAGLSTPRRHRGGGALKLKKAHLNKLRVKFRPDLW